MFWPLLAGKVDPEGLAFEASAPTPRRSTRAPHAADLDVVAVSIARWPAHRDEYLLLPHGMSVGRGYGPVVVATRAADARVARGRAHRRPRPAHDGGARAAPARCRASSRWSSPSARTRAPSRRCARARSTRRSSSTRAASPSSARAWRCVADIGRGVGGGDGRAAAAARRATPSGAVARRAARRAGLAPLPRLDRLGARAPRRDHDRAARARDARPTWRLDRAMLDRYLAMYANADTLDAPADVRRAIDSSTRAASPRGSSTAPSRSTSRPDGAAWRKRSRGVRHVASSPSKW